MTNREKFKEIFKKDLYEICRENVKTVCSSGKKLEVCQKCTSFNADFWDREYKEE